MKERIALSAVALLAVSIIAALFIASRPVRCDHEFKMLEEKAATCESSGVRYLKYKKCGTKTEEEIKKLAHEMELVDEETFVRGDSVYSKSEYACKKCGYTETRPDEYQGSRNEYAAKIIVSFWLVQHRLAALDLDTALVKEIEDNTYRVTGFYISVADATAKHAIYAEVELGEDLRDGAEKILSFDGDDRNIFGHVYMVVTEDGIDQEDRIYNNMITE